VKPQDTTANYFKICTAEMIRYFFLNETGDSLFRRHDMSRNRQFKGACITHKMDTGFAERISSLLSTFIVHDFFCFFLKKPL
jgi:hypothetical protein